MQEKVSPWSIGASLYMPATRLDLVNVIVNQKYEGLKSLILCLEDSVKEDDLEFAMQNLQEALNKITQMLAKHPQKIKKLPLIFIRPRNLEVAKWVTENVELAHVTGFVIPKFDGQVIESWWEIIQSTDLKIMPTLESQDVYDVMAMMQLANDLVQHPCGQRIIVLRIGGNDLMNGLRLRRDRTLTLYDGPLGYVIKMLVTVFAPKGFYLTAPVCEHFENMDLLAQEVKLDLMHGLVGKTIIHPKQIDILNELYQVSSEEYDDAEYIIGATEAVFKQNGSMCEPITQCHWAEEIMARSKYFGVHCWKNEQIKYYD